MQPFVKISIRDLTKEKLEKLENGWKLCNSSKTFNMIWIQGIVRQLVNNDYIELEDDEDSSSLVLVIGCHHVPKGELYECFVRKRALVKYQSQTELI